MSILEEGSDHVLGFVSGILVDPDTGKIEGFFVGQEDFIASIDILRWGARLYIQSAASLAPIDDRIRLQSLLADPRTVLGQKIQTEAGTKLGVCKDVQFNTDSMHIEWIFPRKWFRERIALPVSDILEITPVAIIMKGPILKEAIEEEVTEGEGSTLLKTPPARL